MERWGVWLHWNFISELDMLVSYCFYSKLPQTLWLKKTQTYHLTVLKIPSLEWISLGQNQGVWRVEFLYEVFRAESVFLAFLASQGCPQPLAYCPFPSSKPAMADSVFLMSTFWLWLFSLPLPCGKTLVITLGPPG